LITLTYPNTPECGDQGGATLVLNETVVLGVWIDTNTSSPAYNSVGILRPNNNTIYFAKAVNTLTNTSFFNLGAVECF